MGLGSEVFNKILIPAATSRSVVIGAGVLSAFPVLEMAMRTIQDMGEILTHSTPPTSETKKEKTIRLARKEKLTKEMIIHGFGALILGGCALNPFTGSGAIGLAGYLVFARYTWQREIDSKNQCRSTVFSGMAVQLLSVFGTDFLKSLAEKGKRVGQSLLHRITVIAKAGAKLLNIFRPFIRHPRLSLGLLVGVACLMGYVKYGDRLSGPAAATSSLLQQAAQGVFYGGRLLFQGLTKSAKPIAAALYYLPSVMIKTVQGIISVVHFIFHPLQRMGIA